MFLQDVWQLFEEKIFPAEAPARQFNPYRDRHEGFDLPDAPVRRRANLKSYLSCYEERPPLLMMAEAPGPWGCRFSGVPFTSEAQLVDPSFPINGQPSGVGEAPYKEYSGGIYWRVLQPYFPHFFTWNSVPLHPHQAGEPLSVRNPTRREVAAHADLLEALLAILRPERTVAVGRKAERALDDVGAPCTYVRHPSQGGARKFEAGMLDILHEMGLAAGNVQLGMSNE